MLFRYVVKPPFTELLFTVSLYLPCIFLDSQTTSCPNLFHLLVGTKISNDGANGANQHDYHKKGNYHWVRRVILFVWDVLYLSGFTCPVCFLCFIRFICCLVTFSRGRSVVGAIRTRIAGVRFGFSEGPLAHLVYTEDAVVSTGYFVVHQCTQCVHWLLLLVLNVFPVHHSPSLHCVYIV